MEPQEYVGSEESEVEEGFQVVPKRDYAGVPTAELAALYHENIDTDLVTFASRIGMDERDLKKYVIYQHYAFTGWSIAEKILEGLGLDSAMLIHDGLLHEVPARDSANSAMKIVQDEAWVKEFEPSKAWANARMEELLELRRRVVVKTPEQEKRLRQDSERASARQKRMREMA